MNKEDKQEYITLLKKCLDNNSYDIAKFIEYKHKIIPPKLYRYRAYNNDNIESLRKEYIWLSSPNDFNDLFDSSVSINLLDKNTIRHVLSSTIKEANIKFSHYELKKLENLVHRVIGGENLITFKELLDRNEYTNIKQKLLSKGGSIQDLYEAFKTENKYELKMFDKIKCKITCFLYYYDNILMRSHYADSNKGFCLEYDTTQIKKTLYPILYQRNTKFLNKILKEFNGRNYNKNTIQAFCVTTKYVGWQYEKEWRYIGDPNKESFHLKPTGIYLGTNITTEHYAELCELAKEKKINIKQMYPIIGKYKIKAKKIL